MPMKLFAEGEVVLSLKKSFKSQEGEEVTYYENTVATDDGTLKLNSKEEFSITNVRGVLTIDAQQLYFENGTVKGFKLILREFKEGELGEEEEEIR